MEIKILSYIATVFLTHHIVSIIQASLHCLFGHREMGGYLYINHLSYHHGIYSRDHMISDKYTDEEKNLDWYYFFPVIIVALLGYYFLPFDLFIVHMCSMALSIYAHVYIHTQFHLRATWLNKFNWFRKKQQLHILHHKNVEINFAVVEFFWDKVLGTYQDVRVATVG